MAYLNFITLFYFKGTVLSSEKYAGSKVVLIDGKYFSVEALDIFFNLGTTSWISLKTFPPKLLLMWEGNSEALPIFCEVLHTV
jgi:hypothetical protein